MNFGQLNEICLQNYNNQYLHNIMMDCDIISNIIKYVFYTDVFLSFISKNYIIDSISNFKLNTFGVDYNQVDRLYNTLTSPNKIYINHLRFVELINFKLAVFLISGY